MKQKKEYLKPAMKQTKLSLTYFFKTDTFDLLAGYCGKCGGTVVVCCPGPAQSGCQDCCQC